MLGDKRAILLGVDVFQVTAMPLVENKWPIIFSIYWKDDLFKTLLKAFLRLYEDYIKTELQIIFFLHKKIFPSLSLFLTLPHPIILLFHLIFLRKIERKRKTTG